MPFLPADIARCTVTYALPDNVEAQSRFTAAWNGTTTLSDEDAVSDWEDYLDDIYSVVSADIADTISITGFELSRSTVVGGKEVLEFIGVGTISNQPTNTNDMMVHGACMLFSARLTGAGRGAAKKFWPGFTQAATVNGIFQNAVIANMAPALATWIANFGTGTDWLPGTWSIGKGFRGMIMPVARATPGYQTRRKPGVGI